MRIELASSEEKAPNPSFTLRDIDQKGPGVCDQVSVYDVSDSCTVPKCPIMWKVALSSKSNPERISYGLIPSFGSISVVPPKELQSNKRYALVVDQVQQNAASCEGKAYFLVTEKGKVLITGE